jgi:hypothetical protein
VIPFLQYSPTDLCNGSHEAVPVDSTGLCKSCILVCLDVFHPFPGALSSLMEYPYLKWNMRSDVEVEASQKSVLCRYTGLTRVAISALLLSPIAQHTTCKSAFAQRSLVVGVGDWLHDVIWSTTKQNMQFVVTFPHWTVYGVLSQCLLHRNTRDSPSHE